MDISLNIIRDIIRDTSHVDLIAETDNTCFRHIALVVGKPARLEPGVLYVADASWVSAFAEQNPELYWVCSADNAVLPEATRAIVVEGKSTGELFSLLSDYESKLNRWVQDLQYAAIHNKSMQGMLDLSESVLENYVQITDSSFKLLSYTRGIECDDPVTVLARQYGYHPEETVRIFEKYHRVEAWEKTSGLMINLQREFTRYDMIGRVFRFHNTYFTHAVMTCNVRPYTPGLADLFKIFTDNVSVLVERDWEQNNTCTHMYDSFLADLIDGQLAKSDIIRERAGYLGIPYEGCFSAAVFSVIEDENHTAGFIARNMCDIYPRAKILVLRGKIMVLYIHEKKPVADITGLFSPIMEKYSVKCAVSAEFNCLDRITDAFRQALLALRYAGISGCESCLHREDDKPRHQDAVSFADAFPYMLLDKSNANEEIWKNCVYFAALNRLKDYDRRKGTNNYEFLYVYLMCGCRSTATAEAMFMHRNNVQYRVERITDITGIDLDEPQSRLNLMLAYYLASLFGLE